MLSLSSKLASNLKIKKIIEGNRAIIFMIKPVRALLFTLHFFSKLIFLMLAYKIVCKCKLSGWVTLDEKYIRLKTVNISSQTGYIIIISAFNDKIV